MIIRPMGLPGKPVSLPLWKRAVAYQGQNALFSAFCFFVFTITEDFWNEVLCIPHEGDDVHDG